MAYVQYEWETGVLGGTPISEANLDHLETQYDEADAELTTHEVLDTGVHGAGADTLAVQADITKELWVPATNGTAAVGKDFHTGYEIDLAAETAWMEFSVPLDFVSITTAVVVRIALATATHRLDYGADYAAQGEAYNANEETLADQDTVEVANRIYEQDVSGILNALAAGDYIGMKAVGDAVNPPDDLILGFRLKYSDT